MSAAAFCGYVQAPEIRAQDESTRWETDGEGAPRDRRPRHAHAANVNPPGRPARSMTLRTLPLRVKAVDAYGRLIGHGRNTRSTPAAARLDARIAAGENPRSDARLSHRASQLVSMRMRRRIAQSLRLICEGSPERAR